MSIAVEVGLLSGKTATVEAGLDEQVATLKLRVQTALGVGRGRLLDSSGSVPRPPSGPFFLFRSPRFRIKLPNTNP